MATPVIQSSSTGAGDAASTVTITKPTGLAVGDLMVALVFTYDAAAKTVSDESGWTTIGSTDNGNNGAVKAFWKIADSSDVAASNFTFDFSGSADSGRGIIFRITGHYASAPIASSYINALTSTTSTPSWTPSLNPYSNDPLLIMAVHSTGLTSSSSTIASYTISGTNPTWTEQYENAEATDHTLGVATAAGNSAATITSLSATLSSNATRHIAILLSVPSADTVVATPSSVAVRVLQSAPTFASAVNITPASVAARALQSAPQATARENRWVNETKGTTSWTNETK